MFLDLKQVFRFLRGFVCLVGCSFVCVYLEGVFVWFSLNFCVWGFVVFSGWFIFIHFGLFLFVCLFVSVIE